MNNLSLFNELEQLLRNESAYCSEDGILLKNAIVEAALALRPSLIKLLLSHDGLKRNFFTEIDGVLVFDKIKFQKFVMNKRFLPDSYTSFKNKIGLTTEDGDFISDSREVVLSWPYKDCVLEGGQTKEDAKRNEVFWNEILAPDEINRLTEPKALCNFTRFNKMGGENVTSLSYDDNFIIRGNNLLVLYSLLPKYSGRIKLIYIDPPYNTGSDSFKYNDSFNHASWYTFMHNRLFIAKRLLKRDGIICVQCSFHEFAYLKLLMDELFDKCLATFNIQVRHPDRILTGDKEYNDVIEYILIYANAQEAKMPKQIEDKTDEEYIFDVQEIGEPEIANFDGKRVEIFTPNKYKILTREPNSTLSKRISIRGSLREKNSSGRLFVKHIEPIMEHYPPETIFKVYGMGDDSFGFRRFYTAPTGRKNGGYFQGKPTSSPITEKPYPNYYNFESDYNNVGYEGGVSFRNGKKPEALLCFLINLFSKKDDIILDFHLGSGTTAAVAHKIGRHYIGIEQMDYIKTLACERLKRVIEGEHGGVSQSVNWQGGGSFVYCELAAANQTFVDEIFAAESTDVLQKIWERMQQTGFLSWKVEPKQFEENAKAFEELSLDDQKLFLVECLDKNLLYIPLSEVDNDEFGLDSRDRELTRKFYAM
ncbi:MAG: site-specific DNA-methyltransferase [Bacteroidales bacterium]|nr:site-specific DNA-methyltransferase [Bacteroidales bacterium]MDY5281231.1 site-specific DNA-methyltransferase [Sodaliphilus sp.]